MDALYTGNKISQLRKQHNMTQKDLAQLLSVTDKAVSKWERGINFPDLMTLEKIAEVLHTSVVELLGIEQPSSQQVATEITEIANAEKQRLHREIRWRGWLNVIVGIAIYTYFIYVSKQLYDRNIYPIDINVRGPAGFLGIIVGNSILSIKYAGRLSGKDSLYSKLWRYFRKSKLYGICNTCIDKIWNILLKIGSKSPINSIIDRYFDK